MLFDTHAHYDDRRFDADRDALLSALPQKGVSLVMNIGADMASSRRSVELAEAYPFVYAAVGVHPHEAAAMRDGDIDELRRLAAHPKVRAIGEIGLDYHYDHSPRDVQRRRFSELLALADELDLPAVIHEREACADCLAIVRERKPRRAVFHCYSGSIETARELLTLGCWFSFTGVVTFKNAARVREVVRFISDDRLMLETDAPYMAPEPHRGARCDSSMLARTAEAVAHVRQTPYDALCRLTLENGRAFFGITR